MVTALQTAAAPAPLVAPGPATPASGPAAEPGAFARELDRAARPEEAEPEASAETPATEKPAPNARARSRVAADGKSAERKPERTAVAKPDTLTEAVDPRAQAKKDDDGGTASGDLQALLAGLMAHLHSPPAEPRTAAAPDPKTDAAKAIEAAAGGADGTRPGTAPALPQGAEAATAAASAANTVPAAFTLPTALPAPAAPAEAAPPPPVHQAQVSAAVGTPEFAPGLSAEVNVMLRDGVQEARLQLNPAEMGPITVQIEIDGSNAQIHLSAEQAPTRDALEQALPSLAGTLRDSGLTLTGGGVFEQPRPPRDDGAPAARSSSRGSGSDGSDDGTSTALASTTRRLAPRGVLDLYA